MLKEEKRGRRIDYRDLEGGASSGRSGRKGKEDAEKEIGSKRRFFFVTPLRRSGKAEKVKEPEVREMNTRKNGVRNTETPRRGG